MTTNTFLLIPFCPVGLPSLLSGLTGPVARSFELLGKMLHMREMLRRGFQPFIQHLLQLARRMAAEDVEFIHHFHVTSDLHRDVALVEFRPLLFTQFTLSARQAAVRDFLLHLQKLTHATRLSG